MKKSFLLHIRLSLTVVGIVAFTIAFPTITKAQNGWWTTCCLCGKGFQVDPKPPGYCRECTLLCPGCRKELGDLAQALEKLIGRNRGLMEAYAAHQKDYANAQEKFDDALTRTFGERTGDWTLSGLYGSYGKFNGAFASVISNFGGARLVVKLVPDIISILQSSGPADAAAISGGTLVNILESDWLMGGITKEMIANASNKMVQEIKNGTPVAQAIKNFNRESKFVGNYTKGVKAAGFADVLMDLWGLKNATDDLFNDLSDMGERYTDAIINQNEMHKIRNLILKNLSLMECIKETQDSLNKGGLGFRNFSGTTGLYAVKMIISSYVPTINETMWSLSSGYGDRPVSWQIDTIKLKYTISQLKKLQNLLNPMTESLGKEILPPLVPWIVNRWNELKPAIQVQMLQLVKSPLNVFISKEGSIKSLGKSIDENIKDIVAGNEIDYLSDISKTPGIISSEKNEPDSTTGGKDKWTTGANEKIKGEFGRVNMNFPAGVNWSIDFYTPENKFIMNRSSFSKHPAFYDITPGKYILKLNSIPVENVSVEKGKEVKLKFGIVSLVTLNPWELYNESRKIFYKSGITPVKLALPVGTYMLKFEGKDHRITIKEKVTVKFETPITDLFD